MDDFDIVITVSVDFAAFEKWMGEFYEKNPGAGDAATPSFDPPEWTGKDLRTALDAGFATVRTEIETGVLH